MASMEQTTIARTDGAYLSTATTDLRARRALPIAHWRRILAALCLAGVGAGLTGQSAHVPLAWASGNADAAHACQQGGYANLAGFGSGGQIITFTNEGDCVSYAAHGGQFTTPLPTCTVTATTGCLTFNGVTLPSVLGTGNSITLTGATTFNDTCTADPCFQTVFPNALATGGGDYVETNSSGVVISQGSYRVADTAGSQEGLVSTAFWDTAVTPAAAAACPTATFRGVVAAATLIDKTTGATQTVEFGADTYQTNPAQNIGAVIGIGAADVFAGPVPSTTITC